MEFVLEMLSRLEKKWSDSTRMISSTTSTISLPGHLLARASQRVAKQTPAAERLETRAKYGWTILSVGASEVQLSRRVIIGWSLVTSSRLGPAVTTRSGPSLDFPELGRSLLNKDFAA